MVVSRSWTVLLFLGSALLVSGCIGGGDAAEADGEEFEETTDKQLATVDGKVLTSEGLPIKGATVGLQPGDKTANTVENGTFHFANVEPGKYTLIVQKLGYESEATSIDVVAGQTVTKEVMLEPLAIVESYTETTPHNGVLTCTLATAVWVSPCDYPYTAVYYTLLGAGVNLSNYGVPAEPLENDWRWNTPFEYGSENVITELYWEPVSDASRYMMIFLSCDEYDPVIDDCGEYGWGGGGEGEAPLIRVDWEAPEQDEDPDPVYMTRVYLPWGDTQVALDQKFEVYTTFCYGTKCGDDFTAAPPVG